MVQNRNNWNNRKNLLHEGTIARIYYMMEQSSHFNTSIILFIIDDTIVEFHHTHPVCRIVLLLRLTGLLCLFLSRGGETTWTNNKGTRPGRGQHKTG